MDKISEALHNIDGLITREFNGNEHTTLFLTKFKKTLSRKWNTLEDKQTSKNSPIK